MKCTIFTHNDRFIFCHTYEKVKDISIEFFVGRKCHNALVKVVSGNLMIKFFNVKAVSKKSKYLIQTQLCEIGNQYCSLCVILKIVALMFAH